MGFLSGALGTVNPWAAVGSTAGNLLGDVLQHRWNEEDISQQEAFQSQMSGTAFQRGVADARAAGLNPINMGSAAMDSSPLGTSIPAPAMGSIGTDAVNSGVAVSRASADIDNTKQSTEESRSRQLLNSAQAVKTGFEAKSAESDAYFKGGLMSSAKAGTNGIQSISKFLHDIVDSLNSSAKSFNDGSNNNWEGHPAAKWLLGK